jgi:hypothetical protein
MSWGWDVLSSLKQTITSTATSLTETLTEAAHDVSDALRDDPLVKPQDSKHLDPSRKDIATAPQDVSKPAQQSSDEQDNTTEAKVSRTLVETELEEPIDDEEKYNKEERQRAQKIGRVLTNLFARPSASPSDSTTIPQLGDKPEESPSLLTSLSSSSNSLLNQVVQSTAGPLDIAKAKATQLSQLLTAKLSVSSVENGDKQTERADFSASIRSANPGSSLDFSEPAAPPLSIEPLSLKPAPIISFSSSSSSSSVASSPSFASSRSIPLITGISAKGLGKLVDQKESIESFDAVFERLQGTTALRRLEASSNDCFLKTQRVLPSLQLAERDRMDVVFHKLSSNLKPQEEENDEAPEEATDETTLDDDVKFEQRLTKKLVEQHLGTLEPAKLRILSTVQPVAAALQVMQNHFQQQLQKIIEADSGTSGPDASFVSIEELVAQTSCLLSCDHSTRSAELSALAVNEIAAVAVHFVDIVAGRVQLSETVEEEAALNWVEIAVKESADLNIFFRIYKMQLRAISQQFLSVVDSFSEQAQKHVESKKAAFPGATRSLQSLSATTQSLKTELYLDSSNATSKLQDALELLLPIYQAISLVNFVKQKNGEN